MKFPILAIIALFVASFVSNVEAQTPTVYVDYAFGVHIDETKDFVWGKATIQNLPSTQYHWIVTLSNGQQTIVIYDLFTPSDNIIAGDYTLPLAHSDVYFMTFKVQAVVNNRVTPWYSSPPVAILPHLPPF